jgi:D-alanine-D-alanine ligase
MVCGEKDLMSSDKKKVAVLFGGRSSEHEISVITASEIIDAMDRSCYTPVPVYIAMNGRWYSGDALLDLAFYKTLPAGLEKVQEVVLYPTPGNGGLHIVSKKKGFSLFGGKSGEEIIPIDVFYPAFHGPYGEDGCIQGLFEMADVPYTGCGVLASAVAMDKAQCKSVLANHGIPTLPSLLVDKKELQSNLAALRSRIRGSQGFEQFPLFVKPLNLGSSVGVGMAKDEASLDGALANVFRYDTKALVEPCIEELLEINVSVLENIGGKDPSVSVVEVPVASGTTLTYEDKYLRGGKGKGKGKGKASSGEQRLSGMAGLTRVINPVDLDTRLKDDVQKHALNAYRILGCGGVVRFDFMVDLKASRLYFNELNPLPGSSAFYLWAETDPLVLYPEIISRSIEGAINRKKMKAGIQSDLGFRAL